MSPRRPLLPKHFSTSLNGQPSPAHPFSVHTGVLSVLPGRVWWEMGPSSLAAVLLCVAQCPCPAIPPQSRQTRSRYLRP